MDAVGSSSVEYTPETGTTFRRPSKTLKATTTTKVDEDIDLPDYGAERSQSISIHEIRDTTHRRLKPRHIQLIGIGGTIGTALYVSIGNGLIHGGPGSLFLAFTIW